MLVRSLTHFIDFHGTNYSKQFKNERRLLKSGTCVRFKKTNFLLLEMFQGRTGAYRGARGHSLKKYCFIYMKHERAKS